MNGRVSILRGICGLGLFLACISTAWAQGEAPEEAFKARLLKTIESKVAKITTAVERAKAVSEVEKVYADFNFSIGPNVVDDNTHKDIIARLKEIAGEKNAVGDGFAYPLAARLAAVDCLAYVGQNILVPLTDDLLINRGRRLAAIKQLHEHTGFPQRRKQEIVARAKTTNARAIVEFLHTLVDSTEDGNTDNAANDIDVIVASVRALDALPFVPWPDPEKLTALFDAHRAELFRMVERKGPITFLSSRIHAAQALTAVASRLMHWHLNNPDTPDPLAATPNLFTTTAAKLATMLDAETISERRHGVIALGRMGPAAMQYLDRLCAMLVDDSSSKPRSEARIRRGIVVALPRIVQGRADAITQPKLRDKRKQVVRTLGRALDDSNETVVWDATVQLAQFVDLGKEVAKVLLDKLATMNTDANGFNALETKWLLEALGVLGQAVEEELRRHIRQTLLKNIDKFVDDSYKWNALRETLVKLK